MYVALKSLKVDQLKQLALNCGSVRAGRKEVVADELLHAVQSSVWSGWSRVPAVPFARSLDRETNGLVDNERRRTGDGLRILSLDMGLKNIGVCSAVVRPSGRTELELVALERVNETPAPLSFHQPEFAYQAVSFVHRLHQRLDPDVVLLEEQRLRSGGARTVLEIIARVNILEAMFFATLAAAYPDTRVYAVSPLRVMRYWLRGPAAVSSDRYRETKRAKTALVRGWLDGTTERPFDIGYDALPHWAEAPKQDDQSDAVLQALAWIQWQRNLIRLSSSAAAGYDLGAAAAEMDAHHARYVQA